MKGQFIGPVVVAICLLASFSVETNAQERRSNDGEPAGKSLDMVYASMVNHGSAAMDLYLQYRHQTNMAPWWYDFATQEISGPEASANQDSLWLFDDESDVQNVRWRRRQRWRRREW